MIGGAAFAVLSVVAAFAVSPLMLIVARALLGVAGATLAPSTLALITNMFRDERQRGQAIAICATCQFTGGALGPVLAGFLLPQFSEVGVPGRRAARGDASDGLRHQAAPPSRACQSCRRWPS